MARHNVERATGKPSICSNPRRILSYDTPQIIFWNAAKASSLGPEMHRAHLERLRNQQRMLATDTPTTLLAVAMTPLRNFQVSGWMGGMSTWYRSMLPSAPTLPPHGHCSGHGASKVLSGTGIARTACRPYLDPGFASGLLRVPFRLVLGEGCGLALASAP